MPLTQEQVYEAVAQMRVHCDLAMSDYRPLSARGTLHELGYHGDDCEQILKVLYCAGFQYCLDHKYICSSGIPGEPDEYPSPDVCYWGPDQLKSRLPYYMK